MTSTEPLGQNNDPLRIAIRQFMLVHQIETIHAWANAASIADSTLRNFLKGRSQTITYETLSRLAVPYKVRVSDLTGDCWQLSEMEIENINLCWPIRV
jgi:hypothetical protein